MELWQIAMINKWERMNSPEVMGFDVADEAKQIADFFRSISFICYDTFGTNDFTEYVESLVRGFQFNKQVYDDMHITTTLDLHSIQCTSYGLREFDLYLSDNWKSRFAFALEQGI